MALTLQAGEAVDIVSTQFQVSTIRKIRMLLLWKITTKSHSSTSFLKTRTKNDSDSNPDYNNYFEQNKRRI
jgi:hypothetical protein